MNIVIHSSITHLQPDSSKFTNEELKTYSPETNSRTVYEFSYETPKEGSLEEYRINYARNQIFKHQYHLRMKMLMPSNGNKYVCMKSPLMDRSNRIESSNRQIEPLSYGFDDMIRSIPINQQIPIDTIYTIDVSVPYESNTRYFFDSSKLVSETRDPTKNIDFDRHIHLGCLDIGSSYIGKFTVSYVPDYYDSYTLFTFSVTRNSFKIITYDFMNVDIKDLLKNVLELSEESTKWFIESCIKSL